MKVPYSEKHIEAKLSSVGAKVVRAAEMTFEATKLCRDSNQLLLDAQTEIADLYESLGDVLGKQTGGKKQGKAAPVQKLFAAPKG